jgi:DegV family protein with EDD domain
MRDFVITTESNSDLPKDYLVKNNIGVIPHYYSIQDKVYNGCEEELSIKEFYDIMRQEEKASTMASNPAVIQEMFEAFAIEDKDILHISFSSELSGGCGNVMAGARDICEKYSEMNVKVIDTLSASLGEGLLIRKAVEMKAEGRSLDEIAEWIEANKLHVCVQFTVDDLKHLYRGGRVSKATATIGTMINVKPILFINEEGKLLSLSNVRGRKKSLSMLVSNMEERIGRFKDKQDVIGIVHGDAQEDAQYLASLVKQRLGYDNFIISPIGPSIGAHSGPGAIGLIFMGEQR